MVIDKILVLDVETTGFNRGDNIAAKHQIVSLGLIVADSSLNEIDSFYIEINPDEKWLWDSRAEKVHGLSREHLKANGASEEDAVVAIANFILQYYEPDETIYAMGHNARSFDIPFFNKLMNSYDIHFKFGNRCIDSFGVGFVTLGANDSNELFEIFYPKRGAHNSLEDARMTLGVCRKIRELFDRIT